MTRRFLFLLSLALLLVLGIPASVNAQTYLFGVPQEVVHVYLENDGTLTLDYTITFQNSPKASPIDAVDIGLPTDSYWESEIHAEIDGQPLPDAYITPSPYVTYGLAVNLEEYAIPPGESGTLHVTISNVAAEYYPDTTAPNDASFKFSPNWFGTEFVTGRTDLSISFHLPAGVGPNEARWHQAPTDFPDKPETSLDEAGRVTYTWHGESASAARQYVFGLSLPRQYVLSTIYLEKEQADVFIRADGSVDVQYRFTFLNDSTENVLDELSVDYPYTAAAPVNLRLQVDDQILPPPETAYGTLDLRLGKAAIHPGERKTISLAYTIPGKWLTASWWDEKYSQAVLLFSLQHFSGDWLFGSTDIRVLFHLPPGMDAAQVDWSDSPLLIEEEPTIETDAEGNAVLAWHMPQGDASDIINFVLKMPREFFPPEAVYEAPKPSLMERMGIDKDTLVGFLFLGGMAAFIAGSIYFAVWKSKRRKRQYLPPKIKIAGQGIKRGLTAVEAAVLLEQPADKVLTMILFSTVKKGAAKVVKRVPLRLEVLDAEAQGLRAYEKKFLEAMQKPDKNARRKALQGVMVSLVQAVNKKMKGYNYRQTKTYYEKIIQKAWEEVQAAATPEVQMQTLEKVLPWTMLDEDFDDRSRRVFRTRPVYLPRWWGAYDPAFGRRGTSGQTASSAPASVPSAPTGSRGPGGLPVLPGGEFAASVVTGIQDFSSQVIGDLTDFTGGVTARTNPIPKSSSSGGYRGGGGSSCACACACACAGCACACAGGGR